MDMYETCMKLSEGKKERLYAQYVDSGNVPKKVFNMFVKGDPTQTYKYLEWMLKQYQEDPSRPEHLIDQVNVFNANLSKGKIERGKRDIYQLSRDEVEDVIAAAAEKKTRKEKEIEIKRGTETTKAGADVVKDTSQYKIVKLRTHEGAEYYGKGTKWCISGRTREYWDRYAKDHVVFSVVIPKDDPTNKFAVAVYPGGKKDIYNPEDEKVSWEYMKERVGMV
jgi:hypothetical protein